MNFGSFSDHMTFCFDPAVLDDIRKAVRLVRANTPDSRLADLAEWKLMALGSDLGLSPSD